MKKRIGILLVLILILGVLPACSSKDKKIEVEDEQKEEIKEEPNEAEDSNLEDENIVRVQIEEEWESYYKDAAKRVKKKQPDAKIIFIKKDRDEYIDSLEKGDLSDENTADLFTLPWNKINLLSEKNILAELNARSIAENLNINKNYDEKLVFPMNINTILNFTNIDNSETNSINYLSGIEFTELSNQDILIALFKFDYGVSFMNGANINLLGKTETEEYSSDLTKDFSELSANQQEIFNAIYNYWYYSKKEKSLLFDEDKYLNYMDLSFEKGGGTSILVNKMTERKRLEDLVGQENLDILPLESIVVMGNNIVQYKDGDALAINKRIEEDENKMTIAELMIEEIVNPQYAVEFFKGTGKILENTNLDEFLDSDLEDRDKDFIGLVYRSYEDALEIPKNLQIEEISESWESGILSWNSLEPANVEEAYKILQDEFKSMIEKFK